MISEKIRYIKYNASEYISGVGAMLTAEEQGVYWMICSLMYANGGPVKNDPLRIGGLVRLSKTKAKRIIEKLIETGKIYEKDSLLHQKRTENEIENAQKRIENAKENGSKGGRPPKENNDLEKGLGLNCENLTTNHKPLTINQNKDTNVSFVQGSFEEFWVLFPRTRRGNKQKALKAYKRALKEGRATEDEILEGVKSYARSDEATRNSGQFAKGCESWLNDDRWANDYSGQTGGTRPNGNRSTGDGKIGGTLGAAMSIHNELLESGEF